MYLLKITSNIQLRLDSKQSLSFYALYERSTSKAEAPLRYNIQDSTSNSNVYIFVGMVAVLQCLYFTNMTAAAESGHFDT